MSHEPRAEATTELKQPQKTEDAVPETNPTSPAPIHGPDANPAPTPAAVPVEAPAVVQAPSVATRHDDRPKSKAVAQAAFERGDVEASIAEHRHRVPAPEEHAGEASDYVKSIVFGGLDGIATTFAVVTASAGADATWKAVLVFGFANKVADAFSMGFGEFLSGHAERAFALNERAREEWEVQHNIQGEIDEMVELYVNKGYSLEDATEIVSILSKDPKRFVDVMMVDELGLLVDVEDATGPLKQGVVMFLAFFFFGAMPLIPYLSGHGQGVDWVFGFSVVFTALALMTLGAAKGYLTRQSKARTAVTMLINGAIGGGVSYGIGVLVSYIITGKPSTKSNL